MVSLPAKPEFLSLIASRSWSNLTKSCICGVVSFSSRAHIQNLWQIMKVNSTSSCKCLFPPIWTSSNHPGSRGHGSSSSSGATTPFLLDESPSTSLNGELTIPGRSGDPVTLSAEKLDTLAEKLVRKQSFRRAVLAKTNASMRPTEGLTKEQSAHGRVKPKVYWQYIEAASKWGFGLSLAATLLQQALSIFANVSLKSWGEHNREIGSNEDAGKYLFLYGALSLSSIVLGSLAAIVIWVLCSLRSSKRLHDSVC